MTDHFKYLCTTIIALTHKAVHLIFSPSKGVLMKTQCRSMVLVAPERMEMRTFALPETGEEDGLLEVELVGVCGSDPGSSGGSRPLAHGRSPSSWDTRSSEESLRSEEAPGNGVVEGDRITHTFPLDQAERAVRLVAGEIEGESPLKVVLDPKG
jgi:hypothetical protein